jgi:glycosyltransferase involved in cell wall biosynthesis
VRKLANKIALFLPSLRGGGAERVMVNLARGFFDQGIDVDLVLVKAEGPYLSEVPGGVRVVDLHSSRVLTSLPRLTHYLRRERPQSMLSAMDHANIVAIWARKLSGVPCRVVVSVHSTLSRALTNNPNLRGYLMPNLIRIFYPWADTVVAVSNGVAEDFANITRLPRESIKVIYNPIVIPELLEKAKEAVEHPWFSRGEPPVILSVGRLTKAKDYPTLIRAFALVRRKYPARLMILGEGEERAKLEALTQELGLQDDISLPGFVDNPYAYMARAAVFVLSSAWEGFGNVLVEAMAVGTPVISTDCPSGPAEILENGRWGKLVPVGDTNAMAQAILSTLSGQEVKVGFQNRALKFTIERITKYYLEALSISIGYREQ